jgi:hypothetical protein
MKHTPTPHVKYIQVPGLPHDIYRQPDEDTHEFIAECPNQVIAKALIKTLNSHEALVGAAKDVIAQAKKSRLMIGADLSDSIHILLADALKLAGEKT